MHHNTPAHDPRCAPDECGGKRNRYFRGKNLKVDEFQTEQAYFLERRRLLNRAVTGWGVVHGFAFDEEHGTNESGTPPADAPLAVGRGLALDRHGREIVLTRRETIGPDNAFLVEHDGGGCRVVAIDALDPGHYELSVHYAERRIIDVVVSERCECDEHEKNYVCETAVFSLRHLRERECPCGERDCEHHCRCDAHDSCGDRARGPHACLSEWLTHAHVTGPPTPLREWRGRWLDPEDGVALGCVRVVTVTQDCPEVIVGHVDDGRGPRRLVKSNDLLYDLIRGCDLTRIQSTSWQGLHRTKTDVPWQAFANRFHRDGTTDFSVVFTRPVLKDTLRPDVFVMTIYTEERLAGWRVPFRVPIRDLITDTPVPMDPKLTDRFTVRVGRRWLRDEMGKGVSSLLRHEDFEVEIEVRGDLILDCHCQAVDANTVGFRAAPSGNGTPGGTYLSTFRVEGRDDDDEGEDEDDDDDDVDDDNGIDAVDNR